MICIIILEQINIVVRYYTQLNIDFDSRLILPFEMSIYDVNYINRKNSLFNKNIAFLINYI